MRPPVEDVDLEQSIIYIRHTLTVINGKVTSNLPKTEESDGRSDCLMIS